jgi:hypothetical protein
MYLKSNDCLGEVTRPIIFNFFESYEVKKTLMKFDKIAYLSAEIGLLQERLDYAFEEDA